MFSTEQHSAALLSTSPHSVNSNKPNIISQIKITLLSDLVSVTVHLYKHINLCWDKFMSVS